MLGLLVGAFAEYPGLVDVPLVADHHDAEQQLGGLLERRRTMLDHRRLVPRQRAGAAVPVDRDEIGFLVVDRMLRAQLQTRVALFGRTGRGDRMRAFEAQKAAGTLTEN